MVEGYHDLSRIRAIFPHLDIVITNGREISSETLNELKLLNQTRGLILFLDPDVPGERIRRIINDHVGETAHAFLPKERCISKNKKKVGIEHASREDIINALSTYRHTDTTPSPQWTIQDLIELKLIGHSYAKTRRQQLSESLGIGLANGKTLLRKLQMFGLSKDDIISHLNR